MNNVVLMGRLTRDPGISIVNAANGQMTVARFNLAVDRRFKKEGEQSADFISCVSFGKTAEFVQKYLNQGTKVCLSGRIQTGNYVNKDGQTVYTTDVIAETIEFAESKAASAGAAAPSYNNAPAADMDAAPSAGGSDFMNIPDSVDDEGLPFK